MNRDGEQISIMQIWTSFDFNYRREGKLNTSTIWWNAVEIILEKGKSSTI